MTYGSGACVLPAPGSASCQPLAHRSSPLSTLACLGSLGEHKYAHNAAVFVSTLFPGKVEVVWGDSRTSMRAYREEHPGVMCDGIMVDGLHTYEGAKSDLERFLGMAAPGARMAIDDTLDVEVKRAWTQAVSHGDIHDLGCINAAGRNFCVGRKFAEQGIGGKGKGKGRWGPVAVFLQGLV